MLKTLAEKIASMQEAILEFIKKNLKFLDEKQRIDLLQEFTSKEIFCHISEEREFYPFLSKYLGQKNLPELTVDEYEKLKKLFEKLSPPIPKK